MKYVVHMTTTASLSVEVEIPDDLDEQAAKAAAIEEAYQNAPSNVCAQCGGWGREWSLELGEWDTTNPDGSEIQPERTD